MLIDQRLDDAGVCEDTTLELEDGAIVVRVGGRSAASLAMSTLEQVMRRYGKPLADGVSPEGPALDLGGGRKLVRMRHLARYDVIAKDYLVWSAPGQEPIAELATAIAAALVHLTKAAAGEYDPGVTR